MSTILNTAYSVVFHNSFAENEHKGIDLFLPAPSEILWSFVVVAILGFLFYKFVLPKMDDVFDKRSEKIDGEIENATKIKADAEKLYADYTSQIKDVKLEAAKIKDDARSQAVHIVNSAKVKATNDAELIIKNAYQAVASESKRAENLLKKEVGSLAMSITQRMLQKGVENTERQSKILDDALDKFKNSSKDDVFDDAVAVRNRKASSPKTTGVNSKTSVNKNTTVKRISSKKFEQAKTGRFLAKPRIKDEAED
ncbi:MAG: F0F1 ATP synthase subunit B [Candidatus Ancillula sp.]|jgi:F-type H+-transporting ATPase subunit b|nr:F0F1 ATP synthase subunit B [Candidatus Ancillula sp.]